MSTRPNLTPLIVAANDRVQCTEHGYLADIEAVEDVVECKSNATSVHEDDLTVISLCDTPARVVSGSEADPRKRPRELSSVSEETLFSDGSLLDLGHRSDRAPFPHCTSGCHLSKTQDHTQLRRRLNLVTALAFLGTAAVIIGVSCYYTSNGFRWAVVLLIAQLPLLYILQYSLGILLLPLWKPDILQQNSQFYSANALNYTCSTRPSVTLLLSVNESPLGKEGAAKLQQVQAAAMQCESQGGNANVLLIDADLLALDEPAKAARIALYDSLALPYIGLPARLARPGLHNGTIAEDAGTANLQLRRSRNYVLNLVRRMEVRTEQAKSLGASLSAIDAMHQVWSSKQYDREFFAQGDIEIGDVLITLDMNSNLSAENITSMVNEFAHSDDISFVRSVSSASVGTVSTPSTAATARSRTGGCGASITSQIMQTAEMVKIIMGAIGGVILPADDDFAVKWTTLREVGDAFELASSVDLVEFWDEESVAGSLDLACTLSKRGMLGRYVAYNDLSPHRPRSSLKTAAGVFVKELPAKAIALVQHCWRVGRWDQWHHIIVLTMSPWAVLLAILSGFIALFLAFDIPALWTICAVCAALLGAATLMVTAAVLLSQIVRRHCQQQVPLQPLPILDIEKN